MSNIEEDIKILKEFVEIDRRIRNNKIENDYENFCERRCVAVENILAEREQDKKRIKKLEEDLYSANCIIADFTDSIPKQKAKEALDDIYDYFERLNGPDDDIEYIERKRKELLEGEE